MTEKRQKSERGKPKGEQLAHFAYHPEASLVRVNVQKGDGTGKDVDLPLGKLSADIRNKLTALATALGAVVNATALEPKEEEE